MTPAPNPPPVAESVEQVAKKLAYAFSSDTMGDSLDVWWNGVSDQQRKRYIATVTEELARHRAASHEAGRIAGVREAEGRIGQVLRRLEAACDDLAANRSPETYRNMVDCDRATPYLTELDDARHEARTSIRALSKGEIDGE